MCLMILRLIFGANACDLIFISMISVALLITTEPRRHLHWAHRWHAATALAVSRVLLFMSHLHYLKHPPI